MKTKSITLPAFVFLALCGPHELLAQPLPQCRIESCRQWNVYIPSIRICIFPGASEKSYRQPGTEHGAYLALKNADGIICDVDWRRASERIKALGWQPFSEEAIAEMEAVQETRANRRAAPRPAMDTEQRLLQCQDQLESLRQELGSSRR